MDHAARAPTEGARRRPAADAVASRATSLVDQRPVAAAQDRLIQAMRAGPAVAAQARVLQAMFGDAAQLAPLAGDDAPAKAAAPASRNATGLPDQLKAGVEALSGLSMDRVRVHYNSAQPAQLNALAYAQGTDIHVAPGQERHLPHEAWHVVQQAQGRVRPTLQMKDGVPVNDDSGLELEADIMGARALASPGVTAQRALAPVGALGAEPAVQRYRRLEGGINVSENDQFAVQGEGPGSKLFIAEGVALPHLQHVVLERGGGHLETGGLNLQAVNAVFAEHDELAAMYCGKFSQMVTGVLENVENDTAPVGRSLFVDNLFAIESQYNDAWINHYAPVILQDGDDSGTLETAVYIDHIWFGIYGGVIDQSFRYKTIVADINLQLSRKMVSPDLAEFMLGHLEKFSKTPDVVDKTAPADVLDEAAKLKTQLKQVVDIGVKNPSVTELPSENKRRMELETQALQKSIADLVADIRSDKGGWRDRLEAAHKFTLRGQISKALEAPDLQPAERQRLAEAKTMITEAATFSGDTRPDPGSTGGGPSMLMIIGGIGALAIIGSLLYYATRRK